MKIERVETFYVRMPLDKLQMHAAVPSVTDLGTVIVRITLDNGVTGIGRTYGGEIYASTAVKACLDSFFTPRLVGADIDLPHALWQQLHVATHFLGQSGIALQCLSMIDVALWDIRGKLAGLPIYRLLGAARDQVRVYASEGWLTQDDDELVDACKRLVAEGYTAIKIRLPFDRTKSRARFRAARDAVGPDIDLLVDVQNAWVNAPDAIRRINDIEEFSPWLIEEPVRVLDLAGHAQIAEAVAAPVAGGEHLYTRSQFRDALKMRAFDIIQPDAARVGGLTEWMKIAGMAESWFIPVLPHGAYEVHLHACAAFSETSVPLGEYLSDYEAILLPVIFDDPVLPAGGIGRLPSAPGLGVDLNEDGIREFSVQAV